MVLTLEMSRIRLDEACAKRIPLRGEGMPAVESFYDL